MGVLNNVLPVGPIVRDQQTIASGRTSILNATTPLFTVLVAAALLAAARLRPPNLADVGVSFAGAVAMIGPDTLKAFEIDVCAQLACRAGVLSYACAGGVGRQ